MAKFIDLLGEIAASLVLPLDRFQGGGADAVEAIDRHVNISICTPLAVPRIVM
jgi:hypothetical protein